MHDDLDALLGTFSDDGGVANTGRPAAAKRRVSVVGRDLDSILGAPTTDEEKAIPARKNSRRVSLVAADLDALLNDGPLNEDLAALAAIEISDPNIEVKAVNLVEAEAEAKAEETFSLADLQAFFKNRDASAMFNASSPTDEELEEFLDSGMSTEELQEMLRDEFGEAPTPGQPHEGVVVEEEAEAKEAEAEAESIDEAKAVGTVSSKTGAAAEAVVARGEQKVEETSENGENGENGENDENGENGEKAGEEPQKEHIEQTNTEEHIGGRPRLSSLATPPGTPPALDEDGKRGAEDGGEDRGEEVTHPVFSSSGSVDTVDTQVEEGEYSTDYSAYPTSPLSDIGTHSLGPPPDQQPRCPSPSSSIGSMTEEEMNGGLRLVRGDSIDVESVTAYRSAGSLGNGSGGSDALSEHKERRHSNFVDLDSLDSTDMMHQLASLEEEDVELDDLDGQQEMMGGGMMGGGAMGGGAMGAGRMGGKRYSVAPQDDMMAELAALEAEEEAERVRLAQSSSTSTRSTVAGESNGDTVAESNGYHSHAGQELGHSQRDFSAAAAAGEEKEEVNQQVEQPQVPHKERLIEFYRVHNPGKLREVDANLEHFKGREGHMFALLEHKYNPKAPHLKQSPVYQRLEKFYVKFAPEKLRDIPAIMEMFKGKEEKMWKGLHKKYVIPMQANQSPSRSFPSPAGNGSNGPNGPNRSNGSPNRSPNWAGNGAGNNTGNPSPSRDRSRSHSILGMASNDGAQLKEEVKAKFTRMRKRLSLAM
jgi:hypothetical protein